MEWWQAIVLGVVEGITEYLPISSTGHLILASSLMGLHEPETKSAINAFEIVIQGGAILAVLGLYWPRVVQMIQGVFGQDPAGLRLAINLLVAFLPAAVLGILLDDYIDAHLFHAGPVLGALFVGGIYMMAIDRLYRAKRLRDEEPEAGVTDLSPVQAFVIGLLQCVAMWPGTSRSMMTITGGIIVGMKPRDAAEFSFLLGLPTLGGATVYKLYKNVGSEDNMFEMLGAMPVALGLVFATISAVVAVRWLVAFLNSHGLMAFGWYRIVLSLLLLGLFAIGVVRFEPSEPPSAGAPAASAPLTDRG